MLVKEGILGCIGNTPMVKSIKLRPVGGAEIIFKLEGFNASGSVKARAAKSMVKNAIDRKNIISTTKIAEPSSGNLGLALAMVTGALGIDCTLVVDPRMTFFSESVMRAYGSSVVYVNEPDEKGSWQGSRLKKAREIVNTKNGYMCFQYENPDNPNAHYNSTGDEIIKQLGKTPDACVVGISTGGQITGIGRRLKEHGQCKMVAVDVVGSSIFGDSYSSYNLRGLGLSWWPKNLDPICVDEAYQINEDWAFQSSLILAQQEGILSGGSAGAIVSVAVREAIRLGPQATIIAIIPERCDRYLNQFYSEKWMKEQGYASDMSIKDWTERCKTLEPISAEKLNHAKDKAMEGAV